MLEESGGLGGRGCVEEVKRRKIREEGVEAELRMMRTSRRMGMRI